MRQNTLSVIGQQVRAQTPPDHAGVEYDDGDASARMSSCWAVFYDGGRNESSVIIATSSHVQECVHHPILYTVFSSADMPPAISSH